MKEMGTVAGRMGGKAEAAAAGGERSPWFVLRSGMRRLLVVTLAMACSVAAVLLSTDGLTLFCPSHNAHNVLLVSSSHRNVSYGDNLDFRKTAGECLPCKYSWDEHDEGDGGMISSLTTFILLPGCDYTVGKWIKGENKPLYSGNTCKKWLSGMWACRRMPGRPNFEFENYKWQPDGGCDLPTFTSREFLSRMQNKVVAFVGDSIGRQQYQSLMCMLTGGDDEALVQDVSKLYGLVKPRGTIRADGTAQRFTETNTTIIYYWSASLCELQPLNKTDPNTEYAMHLDRPATFIQKYLKLMDVLVLNTGHHWNRGKMAANRWVMHVDGKVSKNKRFSRDMGVARNFTVHKLVAWLHNQREKNATRAEIYIRSLSPRHFFGGDWDSGGRCDNEMVPMEKKIVTGRAALDPVIESAVLGKRVHLLNVTYISQFRDEAHISKYRPNQSGQDCLHWCLPGVPDVWNELLYAKILSRDKAHREA